MGEQQRRDLLCPASCLGVAFGGGDDRTLHQYVPLTGETVWIPNARLLGQAAQECPDSGQVFDSRGVNRVRLVGDLEKHIDK